MARTLVASRRSLKTNRGDLRNSPSFAQRSCHSWPMAGTVWRPGRPDAPGTVPRGRDRCQLAEILLIDWLFEVEFPKSSPHRLLANSSFIRSVFVHYRQQNWQPCSHINIGWITIHMDNSCLSFGGFHKVSIRFPWKKGEKPLNHPFYFFGFSHYPLVN